MPYLMERDKVQAQINARSGSTEVKVELEKDTTTQVHDSDFQINGEEYKSQETDAHDMRNNLLARDRVRRKINPHTRFGDAVMVYYALNIAKKIEYHEPGNYKEVITCTENRQMILAMREELESMEKNGTWILVDRLKSQRLISYK